jgi:uncharacterized DUF497 family protein
MKMKQDHHITLTGTTTTPTDIGRWVQALVHVHARIAPRFARPEPRRRALAYLHGILAYYVVFAPAGTTLCEMVRAIGARWHIEEDFENAKDMGLDHYEIRCFVGWYRHVTLVMLALAYLASICCEGKVPLLCIATPPTCIATPPTETLTLLVLPLTVPEVRHLLGHLIWPPPRNMPRALAWSRWRRGHQSRASYFHTKRRLKAG